MRSAFKSAFSKDGLVSFASGALCAGAMAPFNLWPLLFAGLSIFYIGLAKTQTPRSAFLHGWIFGFGYFICGLWWISNALLVDGNPFLWVWPLAVAGLPAVLAFFPACAAVLGKRFSDMRTARGLALFIALLSLSEWLRGHIFTGFPWNLYGYAWGGWPAMMQIASLGGSYFLTLLTVFWATVPGFLIVCSSQRKWKVVLATVAFMSITCSGLYGHWRLSTTRAGTHEDITIELIQPNIAQADKWDPEKAGSNLKTQIDLSFNDGEKREGKTTLIVWPETALTQGALRHEEITDSLRRMISSYGGRAYLVTGYLRYEGEESFYNSLAVFDSEMNRIATYDKAHLVPFGEYIPFENTLPIKPLVPFSGFTAGPGNRIVTIPGVPSFRPLVCYEIIFSTSRTEARPDFIINVTNDGWYGDSPGPRQHFMQARFRAIEEGAPVIRSANTGISGVIDPLGRSLYRMALNSRQHARVALPLHLDRSTLYKRLGDIPFFLTVGVVFFLNFQTQKKRTKGL